MFSCGGHKKHMESVLNEAGGIDAWVVSERAVDAEALAEGSKVARAGRSPNRSPIDAFRGCLKEVQRSH